LYVHVCLTIIGAAFLFKGLAGWSVLKR